ncbi:c-type cytochrome biogenesis protein CcmI [uncultured Paracoccus sp.]|uniref:c-type cytochrome biogenesis protein CcmI n=1 Tax=uncultured Paracoccus sp. TaxID=189685 RepID=UPI002609EEF2|nr:c-type cytochrome biogenesis protein CcmI [uncultured Paracoccus sp.]
MFWIIVVAMVAVVALAIALPFLRRDRVAQPAAVYDLRVYRDQLREVDRDRARGVLSEEDAERLRTEIGRKVLDADRALAGTHAAPARAPGAAAALGLLAVLLAGGAALYALELGAPRLPDTPLQARLAEADELYQGRPSQEVAERDAPAPSMPEPDPEYLRLIEQLRAAVERNPQDPTGLSLLAQHESRLGNAIAAKEAQTKLVEALGDRAPADEYARLAALMVEAAGGVVTPEAEAQLRQALALDPQNAQARFMQGLLYAQNGRPDRTFPIWADLLARGPESAPWIPPIRNTIVDLAWLAGQPDYTPPGAVGGGAAMPEPDAAAIAAAENLTPAERQQMIGDMVTRLETRLATQGGTPEEWARLIGALVVVGNSDHAREIWAEAQTRFADRPEALAIVTTGAEQAGLTGEPAAQPGDAPAAAPTSGEVGSAAPAQSGAAIADGSVARVGSDALPAPSAEAVAAASDMSAEDRDQMIAGMVQGLRDRLTTQGGSGAEWGRLVRALSVQGDAAEARAMLAQGRTALADDAAELAALERAAEDAAVR